MKTRLNEVPSLREVPAVVQPSHYNTVRLALIRLGKPLRIELEGLRHLDMLLDDEAWVCVDRMLNDLPVVAWTDFQNDSRSSLNEPAKCQLRLFHAHAGVDKVVRSRPADQVQMAVHAIRQADLSACHERNVL